jgi:hypothetical protein
LTRVAVVPPAATRTAPGGDTGDHGHQRDRATGHRLPAPPRLINDNYFCPHNDN